MHSTRERSGTSNEKPSAKADGFSFSIKIQANSAACHGALHPELTLAKMSSDVHDMPFCAPFRLFSDG